MRVTSIQLQGFRSFEKLDRIELSPINILIGANNAGKSSILRALYLMQDGAGPGMPDVRVGGSSATIQIGIENALISNLGVVASGQVTINLTSPDRRGGGMSMVLARPGHSDAAFSHLPAIDPHHFIVPYLSKRKTQAYQEDVRQQFAMQVLPSMSNLAAKLSRISNPSFPNYDRYNETCRAILGFLVTAVPSESGQRPGVYLPNRETLPIDQMGEGVPNIVALLAELAISEGKLFLVEEPENDLHPKALKALLDLIIESSKSNQFVISTHSNIVLRHLGAVPESRVFEVSATPGKLPVEAKVRMIESTPQARIDVLRDLGYSFSDFDLWDGWLFLEEASAERIIRDYLIPWFAPKLLRVRTLSAGGAGNVEPTFEDFHRLIRFTHLEKAYTNAAWVRVDGDEVGEKVVEQLKRRYPTWESDRFACFSHAQFEYYYPSFFAERIASALLITDKQRRREAKRLLLDDVRKWLDEDMDRAKSALEKSANEVIQVLRKIESQLIT